MPSTAPEISVSTVAATATCTGHHMLKIEGFKHLRGMHGNGSYFESCRFDAAGHTWKLLCYPDGKVKEAAGYISLFLLRDEEEESGGGGGGVHAEYQLALVYPRSRLLPWIPYDDCRSRGVRTFRHGHGWGFPQFISVKTLESLGLLKHDCLAVRCDITVVEKSAVKDEVVKAADMERLGMLCKCNDDLCKRHHRRPAEIAGKKIRKAFVRFFRSIGG